MCWHKRFWRGTKFSQAPSWLKNFWLAQNILGPVKGRGISACCWLETSLCVYMAEQHAPHTIHQPGKNSMLVNLSKDNVIWVIAAWCVTKKPKTVLLTTVLKTVAFIAGKKIRQPKSFLLLFPLKIWLQTSVSMH